MRQWLWISGSGGDDDGNGTRDGDDNRTRDEERCSRSSWASISD